MFIYFQQNNVMFLHHKLCNVSRYAHLCVVIFIFTPTTMSVSNHCARLLQTVTFMKTYAFLILCTKSMFVYMYELLRGGIHNDRAPAKQSLL